MKHERSRAMSGNASNIIEQARLARGYTQEQVAQAIGVSRPTFYELMRKHDIDPTR